MQAKTLSLLYPRLDLANYINEFPSKQLCCDLHSISNFRIGFSSQYDCGFDSFFLAYFCCQLKEHDLFNDGYLFAGTLSAGPRVGLARVVSRLGVSL